MKIIDLVVAIVIIMIPIFAMVSVYNQIVTECHEQAEIDCEDAPSYNTNCVPIQEGQCICLKMDGNCV